MSIGENGLVRYLTKEERAYILKLVEQRNRISAMLDGACDLLTGEDESLTIDLDEGAIRQKTDEERNA